jgi:hypothetical protein
VHLLHIAGRIVNGLNGFKENWSHIEFLLAYAIDFMIFQTD